MVSKKSAIDYLQKLGRANVELSGPIEWVGEQKSTCKHSAYSIRLPLKYEHEAVLSSLCLNKVTATFPIYLLKRVMRDFMGMGVMY